MAAAKPGFKWATVDPTLWNMAFTGHARVQRCKYCFSLSHQASDSEWAPSPRSPNSTNNRSRSNTVCKSWNFSAQASCEFNNCSYQHVCLLSKLGQIKGTRSLTAQRGSLGVSWCNPQPTRLRQYHMHNPNLRHSWGNKCSHHNWSNQYSTSATSRTEMQEYAPHLILWLFWECSVLGVG